MEVDSLRDDRTEDLVHRARGYALRHLPRVLLRDRMRRRTRQKRWKGLFIAAKEDSDGWPTSYDYLNVVRSGYLAVVLPKTDGEDEHGEDMGKRKDSTA